MTSKASEEQIIVLPPRLTVSGLERTMYGHIAPLSRRPTAFDLSACSWTEPAVLLYLGALLSARSRAGLPTSLRLPRSTKVREFLAAWRFYSALNAVLRENCQAIVVGEDIGALLLEEKQGNAYVGPLINTPFGADRLLSKYYFEIHTFHSQFDLFQTSFALNEAAKWSRVARVLRTVLGGPANLFASRIVYEALVNAIRHPKADLIQFVSQLRRGHDRVGDQLLITFWDNGKGIADTLQSAVQRGGVIRSATSIGLRATYNVRREEAFAEAGDVRTVGSDDIPGPTDTEDAFLLASVFPGTTSNPTGTAESLSELDDVRDPILSQPGMGLYLLANTAVSVYRGDVVIRSGQWRLTLRPGEGVDAYQATLRRYENWPRFNGNLISVRLPLVGRQQ